MKRACRCWRSWPCWRWPRPCCPSSTSPCSTTSVCIRPRRAGPGAAHRGGRPHLLRPGRLRRAGRLRHGYLTTAHAVSPWLTLLIGLAVTAVVALVLGFLTLRLSGHYLPLGTIAWGISLYFLFGNLEFLGGHTGLTGIPALEFFGLKLDTGRSFYYLIWLALLGAVLATQNLLDSREGRAIRALKGGMPDGRSHGCRHRPVEDRHLSYCRPVRLRFGLALCPPAALRQPDAVRAAHRHRVSVHGGGGRIRRTSGAHWSAPAVITVLKQWLQDCCPGLLGAERQLRNDCVRHHDDPGAAARARWSCGRWLGSAGAIARNAILSRRKAARCRGEADADPQGQVAARSEGISSSDSAAWWPTTT
jgi:hypothetical protein